MGVSPARCAGRASRGRPLLRLRPEPVERLDQLGPRAGDPDLRVGQDPRQGDPAEIGHAEQVQPGRRVGSGRIDRDDVRVLEPGQHLRLRDPGAAHLQGHRPVGQLSLGGQEDAGEGAPAQFLDQLEAGDRLAGLGEKDRRPAPPR